MEMSCPCFSWKCPALIFHGNLRPLFFMEISCPYFSGKCPALIFHGNVLPLFFTEMSCPYFSGKCPALIFHGNVMPLFFMEMSGPYFSKQLLMKLTVKMGVHWPFFPDNNFTSRQWLKHNISISRLQQIQHSHGECTCQLTPYTDLCLHVCDFWQFINNYVANSLSKKLLTGKWNGPPKLRVLQYLLMTAQLKTAKQYYWSPEPKNDSIQIILLYCTIFIQTS